MLKQCSNVTLTIHQILELLKKKPRSFQYKELIKTLNSSTTQGCPSLLSDNMPCIMYLMERDGLQVFDEEL